VRPRGTLNPGAHGFSEILYAFSSAANNNGSAFAGLTAATPFYDVTLGLAMLIGRYWLVVRRWPSPARCREEEAARRRRHAAHAHPAVRDARRGDLLVVGALALFPALALGPIVEHLMVAGAR